MFNDKSKSEQPGVVLPVVVTYFKDKSFEMEIKMPPASYFIKEALNIKKGSKEPGRERSLEQFQRQNVRKLLKKN
jgi:large subunit ribosomal protein L11